MHPGVDRKKWGGKSACVVCHLYFVCVHPPSHLARQIGNLYGFKVLPDGELRLLVDAFILSIPLTYTVLLIMILF